MFPWSVTHVNDSGFPVFERGKRAKHSTGYRGTGRPSGQLKDDRQSVVKEARRINKDPRQRLRSRKLRSAQYHRYSLGSPPRHQHDSKSGSGTTGTTSRQGSTTETRSLAPAQSTAHHQRGGHTYGKGSDKAPWGRQGPRHRPPAEGRRVPHLPQQMRSENDHTGRDHAHMSHYHAYREATTSTRRPLSAHVNRRITDSQQSIPQRHRQHDAAPKTAPGPP